MAEGEITCSLCLVELDSMLDPRSLPCNHICCLDCMKGDHTTGAQSYRCPSCGRIHEPIELDALPIPEAALKKNKQLAMASSAELLCDICQAESAVSYCSDCGNKICSEHLKHHNGYFITRHKTEDIETFAQNIGRHERVTTCPQHGGETITMACENCHWFNCAKCYSEVEQRKCPVKIQSKNLELFRDTASSSNNFVEHVFIPLPDIRNRLKIRFERLMQRSSNRVPEIAWLEKDALLRMSKLTNSCKTMLDQLEKRSREQIEMIKEQTQRLREDIQAYQTENTNKVEQYVGKLSEKEHQIADVRKSTHQFIHNSLITTLIKEHEERVALITDTNDLDLGTCEWRIKRFRTAPNEEMNIRFVESEFNSQQYGGGPFGTLTPECYGEEDGEISKPRKRGSSTEADGIKQPNPPLSLFYKPEGPRTKSAKHF